MTRFHYNRFRQRDRLSALSEINVTPLIDLAFALLIIFMITTPLLEQTIAIDLPVETQKLQPPPAVEYKTITLNREGHYYWEGQRVSKERLASYMAELKRLPDPPILTIRADAQLPYQEVIALIDLIQQHQLSKSLN